jgi:hypothetical protein
VYLQCNIAVHLQCNIAVYLQCNIAVYLQPQLYDLINQVSQLQLSHTFPSTVQEYVFKSTAN